jgi:hypothetical protein
MEAATYELTLLIRGAKHHPFSEGQASPIGVVVSPSPAAVAVAAGRAGGRCVLK